MSGDIEILAVLTGKARPFRGEAASAIAKQPAAGALRVGLMGLAGDEQADPVNHGGPDKALHHYPYDHYPHWRAALGPVADLAGPGGFGENISTLGLAEDDVWLGDRFRLGTALVEVSHGRQPCWKLGHRLGDASLAAQVTRSGRAGWYYRVVEEGAVAAGDRLVREGRGLAEWPLSRLFHVLIGGGHKADRGALEALASLPVLAVAWRQRAAELRG